MLRLNGVSKTYGGIEAVRDFDLELPPGKITALIGPNGAGKTTLFHLITGFACSTAGSILWQNEDLTHLSPFAIHRLGIARTFQEVKLFRSLTVMDNLLMARRKGAYENLGSAFFFTRAVHHFILRQREGLEEQLRLIGLAEKADERASSLSYGQSKLVEILRALATEPAVLLLDEPAAGLNPMIIRTIKDFLRNTVNRTGLTLFLIEHNMNFVFELADHVAVLDHGVKIAEGPPEVVRNDPRVIEAYLG